MTNRMRNLVNSDDYINFVFLTIFYFAKLIYKKIEMEASFHKNKLDLFELRINYL